jgi:hypothetical protein
LVRLAGAATLLALAATGVGFGGLSAWQVTSQNTGTVATGSVHHSNTTQYDASGNSVNTTCLDSGSASPGTCGMVFKIAALRPAQTVTGGTLTIVNTGTLAAGFVLTELSAPTTSSSDSGHTTLCSNLTVVITDNESTPATLYSNPLVFGQGGSPNSVTLKSSTGATSWAASASGVFTFAITLSSSSPYTDSNSTCTATMLVTETNS